MDKYKLEDFVEAFNSRDFEKCNMLINEIVQYQERGLDDALRKIVYAMSKIKTGNLKGAEIPMKEGIQKLVFFRQAVDRHIPGFTSKFKRLQNDIKKGKADIPKLEFRL